MDKTNLSPIVYATTDPRYLINIDDTLKKLDAIGLSLLEIEELFLNPAHRVYFLKPGPKAVWLVELEIKENGDVDILKGGRSINSCPPEPGSVEAMNRQMDKTIIRPISVLHACPDLATLSYYREILNEEPDFSVVFYKVDKPHYLTSCIGIQVNNFDLTKLEEYADNLRSLLGDYCLRVYYHSFKPSVDSPDSYFSKSYPITKCGLIIHKLVWESNRFRKTNNAPSSFFSYLQKRNCTAFQIIDDNPEFWKIVFETSVMWGDNLHDEMRKDGFRDFRLYTDANQNGFIHEEYTGIHYKVVPLKHNSYYEDEETIMRALANGQGEFYGRD